MGKKEEFIFALDIGTRTIIGLVMEYRDSVYNIIASEVVEQKTRSMMDGQIHNVSEVVNQVEKLKTRLENRLDIKLKKVAIAAAGRALKTITCKESIDFQSRKVISEEDVQALEYAAIQNAQKELAREKAEIKPSDYHFVGYSVIEYQLEGLYLVNLVGQRGRRIQVEMVVTFLPRIVIDSLLTAINQVGLEVENMTLEPIAAAEVIIPPEMYNFNLALVDIGAGTSDIALTRKGAMIGYAMVPVAGDEVTEILSEHYLFDFDTAERIKRCLNSQKQIKCQNIMGQEITVEREEALSVIESQVQKLSKLIASEIIEINKKPPQAVICIGGGSLTPLLIDKLQEELKLPAGRVGIKGNEELKDISGKIDGINSTQTLTPIGIAVNSHKNRGRAVFLKIKVNGEILQMFSLNQPAISDALLAAEIDIKELRGKTGRGLTVTLNGKLKTIKGTMGKPGFILLNGKKAELDFSVSQDDEIEFVPGESGKNARAVIGDILPPEIFKSVKVYVNGNQVKIVSQVLQNGQPVEKDTPVKDGAVIKYNKPGTIREGVARILEMPVDTLQQNMINFILNGEKMSLYTSDYLIMEGENLVFEPGKEIKEDLIDSIAYVDLTDKYIENNIVDLDRPLKEGVKLQIIENRKKNLSLADILDNEERNISINFNGNFLDIPVNIKEFEVNGEKRSSSYVVKGGDVINCHSRDIDVEYLLNYINFKLSPELKERVNLLINGSPAEFDQEIKEGDKIKIDFIH